MRRRSNASRGLCCIDRTNRRQRTKSCSVPRTNGLRLARYPRPGQSTRLTEDQWTERTATRLASPSEAGYDESAWTPALVRDYIAETFNVGYSLAHMYRVMKRARLSYQTAHPRHYKADPAEQQRWCGEFKKNWPTLKGRVMLEDEADESECLWQKPTASRDVSSGSTCRLWSKSGLPSGRFKWTPGIISPVCQRGMPVSSSMGWESSAVTSLSTTRCTRPIYSRFRR